MTKLKTFFIFILFYPLIAFGQNPDELSSIALAYGSNHESAITELGEIHKYSFDGSAGDVIMLRMRDETKVDAYIKLYDPDGDLIGSSWSDGGLAKIKDLKLEKTGQFNVLAYDKNHNDIGKYGISLHKLNKNNYSKAIPEIISFEDEIKELVGVNFYQFNAEAGDVLFTQMRAISVHLECEFFIYNSNGDEVLKSSKKGRSAIIGPVALEETDSYTLVVTDRGGNDTDKFGLTNMLLNKHESIPNLNCGDNSSANLGFLVERKCYRLKTAAGQIPLIEARSNNNKLEMSFEVYDENGEMLVQKSQTNKLLSTIIPPSDIDKSYLIAVYDRNGNDLGDFGLQVQFLDDSYCPDALSCTNQEDIISIDGLAQNRLFSVQGVKDQPINIILKETDPLLEPNVRIYNLQGEMILEEFDGVKVDLSNHRFPENGKYLVLASDRSGNDIGEFEISAPLSESGLHMEITGCQSVYSGFDAMAWATISVVAPGNNLTYLWSNGETSSSIHVLPIESTNYSVTVTNASGCSVIASSYVEVVDVRCGSEDDKVTVCHVKSNGQHQEKCVSISGVWSHLDNGNGHEECHIGPCNHISACDSEGQHLEEVTTRALADVSNGISIFPNPTANEINIDLSKTEKESISFSIYNTSGTNVYTENLANKSQVFSYSMIKSGLPYGVYFVKVESDEFYEVKEIIFLK